jgi:hypothetical protein
MDALLTSISKALSGAAQVNVVLFFTAALIGQALYGVRKWTQGEAASPVTWFTSNVKATVAAVITNIGVTTLAVSLLPIESMTAYASLFAGLLCGLGSDAVVNKGVRPDWTPEQRAAASAKP